jgi:GNAT superfamily N-acetyltransferase
MRQHNVEEIINFLKSYLPYYDKGEKSLCYWHESEFVSLKIRNREIYTEFDNNKLIGIVLFTIDKEWEAIRVDSLAVHPDYRKRGIGKRLIKKIERRGKDRKIPWVSIGSLKEYNALGFYQFLGYELILTDEFGYEFEKRIYES